MDGGRRKKTMGKGPEWLKWIRPFAAVVFFSMPLHSFFSSVTYFFFSHLHIYDICFLFICAASAIIPFYIWHFLR